MSSRGEDPSPAGSAGELENGSEPVQDDGCENENACDGWLPRPPTLLGSGVANKRDSMLPGSPIPAQSPFPPVFLPCTPIPEYILVRRGAGRGDGGGRGSDHTIADFSA